MKKLWPATPALRRSCYTADLALLLLAGFLALHEPGPMHVGRALLIGACVLLGAALALVPYLGEFWKISSPSAAPADDPVQPEFTMTPQSPDTAALVEIALLAWRIRKRAARNSDEHRSILRNAERILELLTTFDVELVSYEGRKLDLGSRVNVLEWDEGEEGRVLEEHEPQIQLRGRLVHQALVTAGRGVATAAPTTVPAGVDHGNDSVRH